jgi:hypothetical protein
LSPHEKHSSGFAESWTMPRIASGMPRQRNPNSDAERSQIQTVMTRANRYIPISSRIAACIAKMQTNQRNRVLHPNENRITDPDQAD